MRGAAGSNRTCSRLTIRPEAAGDLVAIRAVNEAAFGRSNEADLVAELRRRVSPLVSLVAGDAAVVGHILFSPVTLSDHADVKIMALAPMAVLPAEQRRGVGSALVRAGLERCNEIGCGAVIVLGQRSIVDLTTALMALVCVGLIWKVKKLPEPVLVAVAAIIGLAAFPGLHQ